MTLLTQCLVAAGIALALSSSSGAAQGVAPPTMGTRLLGSPPAPLFRSRLGVLAPHTRRRVAANLPTCAMPVAVPDQTRSERMPGSHAPSSASVGPEPFGCTNPLGPAPEGAGAPTPVQP